MTEDIPKRKWTLGDLFFTMFVIPWVVIITSFLFLLPGGDPPPPLVEKIYEKIMNWGRKMNLSGEK